MLVYLSIFSFTASSVFALGTYANLNPSSCSGSWTNCANAYDSDADYASVTNTANQNGTWSAFGASIPSDAVIMGVSLQIDASASLAANDLIFQVWDNDSSTYIPAGGTLINIAVNSNNRRTFNFSLDSYTTWQKSNIEEFIVAIWNIGTGGPTSRSWRVYYIVYEVHYNRKPNTPNVTLESTIGTNTSNAPLNCSATITDPDGDPLNVTVKWYESDVEQLSINYFNEYASGTVFDAILAPGNTTRGDIWNCSITLTDGNLTSNTGYSSSLEIVNSPPILSSVTLEDQYASPLNQIEIVPGDTSLITCTSVLTDYDSPTEVSMTGDGIYLTTVGYGGTPDPLDYYENNSCDIDDTYGDIYQALINCSYDVIFYALPGSWTCHLEVEDAFGATDTEEDTSTMQETLAFDISDGNIDFGLLLKDEDTGIQDFSKTVSNIGNVPLDIAMNPFADTVGDGYSMQCTVGYLDDSYLKYSLNTGVDYSLKTSLTSNAGVGTTVLGFDLPKQTSGSSGTTDDVHFGMGVGNAQKGNCNGNIMFTALQSA